mmetsp:Transcript_29498/g.56654  ORF Transcript_29498/g.56654 Transcript_29498/m.56654 type:complete len:225 (-) Transcript_29498:277-951(-)
MCVARACARSGVVPLASRAPAHANPRFFAVQTLTVHFPAVNFPKVRGAHRTERAPKQVCAHLASRIAPPGVCVGWPRGVEPPGRRRRGRWRVQGAVAQRERVPAHARGVCGALRGADGGEAGGARRGQPARLARQLPLLRPQGHGQAGCWRLQASVPPPQHPSHGRGGCCAHAEVRRQRRRAPGHCRVCGGPAAWEVPSPARVQLRPAAFPRDHVHAPLVRRGV